MALKTAKATTPPELVARSAAPEIETLGTTQNINFEEMVADEILNTLDWQKVREGD
jgi:hypothetical protein